MRNRNGNRIQVRPSSRPENSPPLLYVALPFVVGCKTFLRGDGGVAIGSIHAPLLHEQNGVATQNMLLHAIAWAGEQPVDQWVDYKPPPVPQRQ
ncbi:MAG: hypothetical protein ACJ8R9_19755 [Steroidobacteraceae bacterium]